MDTKALRQKVLDLAIRGKLVPQDPNDEPASVLLEKIRAKKQQMVKEGKLKAKDIKNDTIIFKGEDSLHYEKFADGSVKCIEDEIPFELPEGWMWARLGTVAEAIGDGDHQPPPQTSSGIPFLVISNISGGALSFENTRFVSIEYFNQLPETRKPRNGDLLFSVTGSYGIPVLVDTDENFCFQRHIAIVRPCIISNRYLYVMLGSSYVKSICDDKATGTAQKTVGLTTLRELLIPIAPFNEQIQIYAQAQAALCFVDGISSDKEDLQNTIERTKSKILDLAIRGQLVAQNPDDEPASVLLERIRAEKEELIKQGKIKRDKKESVIFKGEDNSYYEKFGTEIRCIDAEIPFEIPDGWTYERLGNICSVARGGSPRPIENYLTDEKNGLNWIKIGDTEQGGKYIFSTREKIRPEGLSKTRYVHCGDFLLTNSMSFGRPYILKTDGCIHDGWLVIGDVETIFYQDFLYYMLSSSAMYNALSSLAVGSTVKNLKSDSVKSLIVPIPPIREQKLIADRVEMFLMVTDQIEKSLN